MLALLAATMLDDIPGIAGEVGMVAFAALCVRLIVAVYREMAQAARADKDKAVDALAALVKSVDAYTDETKQRGEDTDTKLDAITVAVTDIATHLRRSG